MRAPFAWSSAHVLVEIAREPADNEVETFEAFAEAGREIYDVDPEKFALENVARPGAS